MEKRIYPQAIESVVMPEPFGRKSFDSAEKAVKALRTLYDRNTKFLRDSFAELAAAGGDNGKRYRAFYPEIGVTTNSFTQIDSRQAYGHMPTPGHFSTTITQPGLFESYLVEQLRLIMRNHGVAVTVSESTTPIPLHFAFLEGTHVDGAAAERIKRPIRDLFDVNVMGVINVTLACRDSMRERGGGVVLNISSMAGIKGYPGHGSYGASKWGVRGLTKTAAKELGHDGIRVNSVHPGAIATDMLPEASRAEGTFAALPAGRAGTADEVANLVLFLASDESSYITASEHIIDGGSNA
jgi:NAD(P)-dependent dehydrogenase (short-subunit alcohol dehydrogenase family)